MFVDTEQIQSVLTAIGYDCIVIFLLAFKRNITKCIDNIPVVKPNTILGFSSGLFIYNHNSNKNKFNTHDVMMDVANVYGGIAQYNFFGRHVLLVNDQYISKYVLDNVHGKGYLYRGNKHLTHESIFNMDTNAMWKKRRLAYRHPFTPYSLRQFSNVFHELSHTMCDKIDKLITNSNSPDATTTNKVMIPIDKIFGELAIDAISRVAFQYDMGALQESEIFQQLHDDVRTIFENFFISRIPFAHWLVALNPPIESVRAYRMSKLRMMIFKRNMLRHLQSMQESNELDRNGLGQAILDISKDPNVSDMDILEDINTIFIAGHETTAHTLSFFIYVLARYPEIQAKCQSLIDAEISSAEKDAKSLSQDVDKADDKTADLDSVSAAVNTGVATTAQLPPYIEAVLKESMRHYPVAGRGPMRLVKKTEGFTIPKEVLNRSRKEAAESGDEAQARSCNPLNRGVFTEDLVVPNGTWIHTQFHCMHNSVMNWGSDAGLFVPERWLLNSRLSSSAVYAGGGESRGALAFAPFGHGPRNCLGMNLALLEMRLSVRDLIRRFHFSLPSVEEVGFDMRDEDVLLETTFTLRPKDMMPIMVERRS